MSEVTVTNSPALLGGVNSTVVESHEGTVTVPFAWTAAGNSVSSSSLIMLARIPHGAVITNLQIWAWCPAAEGKLDVGLAGQASADYLVDNGAFSNSATTLHTINVGALPMTCSLTDADAQPRWRYLQAKVASLVSSTVTAIIRGAVTYVCGTGRTGL
jgi:hypothetical protein